jgi:hypothetical protein
MKKILCSVILLYTSITSIYAKENVTITFYDEDGQVQEVLEVEQGQRFTIPTEVKEGYNFLGYNTARDGSGEALQSNVASKNTSYYPVFQPLLYTVTYYIDNRVVHQEKVEYGKNASDFIPPDKEGYTFSGWEGLQNITEERQVIGTYQEQKKVLTFKRVEIQENNQEVQKNEEVTAIEKEVLEQQDKELIRNTTNYLILIMTFLTLFSLSLFVLIKKK